jgi:hypothetical protein
VSRRYGSLPGADEARLAALIAKVDRAETTLNGHGRDITALGHGLARVTATLRDLGHTPEHAPEDTADPQDGPEQARGQRDWLRVTDPATACEWLVEAVEWTRTIGDLHHLSFVPCWPLHPETVAEVLALAAERTAAYSSDSSTAVCEYLSRWLPAARDRIREALEPCHGGHQHGQQTYYASGLDVTSVATWWATDRATPAPAALRLHLIDR